MTNLIYTIVSAIAILLYAHSTLHTNSIIPLAMVVLFTCIMTTNFWLAVGAIWTKEGERR